MYQVNRNNFYRNPKNSKVFTPEIVSNFLFNLLHKKIDKTLFVFDPCVGEGSLLKPFHKNGFKVFGVDIENQGFKFTYQKNFLKIQKKEISDRGVSDVGLIIVNPPFNIDRKTKNYLQKKYGGRPLLPEVWLQKIIELFGRKIPLVLFVPYGFRLNQTLTSKRWKKFANFEYPQISSIISLPKNIFTNVHFHSEILIFNLPTLKGHYFLKEIYKI